MPKSLFAVKETAPFPFDEIVSQKIHNQAGERIYNQAKKDHNKSKIGMSCLLIMLLH